MKVNKVICYAGLVGLLLGSAKAAAQSPSPSPGPNDNQAYAAYAAWDTADFHSIQIYSTPPGNFTCPNNGTLLWYGWLVGKGTDVGTTSLADGTSKLDRMRICCGNEGLLLSEPFTKPYA